MRVRRHRGISRRLRLLGSCFDKLNQLALQLVDGVTHKQTQIGCNLLVTAASRMELESNFAGKLDQTTFKEVVNILSFAVLHEVWIGFSSVLDVFQSFEKRFQLSGG